MPQGTSGHYFVEVVTAAKRVGLPYPAHEQVDVFATTAWEYQVKWALYNEAENTWEPPNHLGECEELLTSFWEHVGGDDTFKTALEGFEVAATSEWIGRQRDRFWRETTKAEVVAQNRNSTSRTQRTRKTPRKPKSRKKRKVEEPDASPSSPPAPVVEPPLEPENATVASTEQPENEPQVPPPQTPDQERRSARIMTIEPKNIQSASTLRTKYRLGSQQFAPAIPRYVSPCPSQDPASSAAETSIDGDMEVSADSGDFLELTRTEEGNGIYAPGEDPYASMRSEMGEPVALNMEDDLHEVADNFLRMPESSEIHTTSVTQWTWSGQLTVTALGVPQLVAQRATIVDSTQPNENGRPMMNAFLPVQDLNLCKLYEVRDLAIAVSAFKPAHQFARLVAADEEQSFQTFVKFLSCKEQAALFPAIENKELLGYIFIIPPSASDLLTALGAPSEFHASPSGLVVALLFLITGSSDCHPTRSRSVIPLRPREKLSQMAIIRDMHTELAYRFALCITVLPEHVLQYTMNHPSVVWPAATKDLDTAHLRCALSKSHKGIIDARGAASKAGTVFVHVRALPFVHSLPDIVQLRRRPEVRFYLYGTHPSVPPQRWGHRAIFLLGGIVTFTVAALAVDPWGVLSMIRRIAAHPLWECYILPQVFGLAVRLNEEQEDSLMEELGDSGLPLALDRILDAVLQGQVAILCTPGSQYVNQLYQDKAQLLPICREDKDALLDRCRAACGTAFPDANFETAAREEVRADMCRMQTQPLLVESYRRYVAIDVGLVHQQDGIEWQDIGRFSFNDALDSLEWE